MAENFFFSLSLLVDDAGRCSPRHSAGGLWGGRHRCPVPSSEPWISSTFHTGPGWEPPLAWSTRHSCPVLVGFQGP